MSQTHKERKEPRVSTCSPYELVAPATWSEGTPVCHGPCRVRTALKNRGLLRVGEGVGREGTSLHSSSGVWTVLLPLKNGTCRGDFSSVWQTPDKDSRRKGGFVVTCRSRGYSPDGRQHMEAGAGGGRAPCVHRQEAQKDECGPSPPPPFIQPGSSVYHGTTPI